MGVNVGVLLGVDVGVRDGVTVGVNVGVLVGVFDGVTVRDSFIACACEGLGTRDEQYTGNTWGDGEHCTEIVFANITAEDCSRALLLGDIANNDDDFNTNHVIVSNFIGRNIGDATVQWSGTPLVGDCGVVWIYNATNLTINGMSIGNDNVGGYATIGAFMRGRGKDIRIWNDWSLPSSRSKYTRW